MRAVVEYGTPLVDNPRWLAGVTSISVDETSFLTANRFHHTEFITGVVALPGHGRPQAQLLDVMPGRCSSSPSATAGIGTTTTAGDCADALQPQPRPRAGEAPAVVHPGPPRPLRDPRAPPPRAVSGRLARGAARRLHPTGRCPAGNGPTEALNMLIRKVKRIGHGFHNLRNTGYGCCCPSAWTGAPCTDRLRLPPRSEAAHHASWRRAQKAPPATHRATAVPTTSAVSGPLPA